MPTVFEDRYKSFIPIFKTFVPRCKWFEARYKWFEDGYKWFVPRSKYLKIGTNIWIYVNLAFPYISIEVSLLVFIRPSSDGTYYGMVMSVRVSGRPSVRLSVRPSGSPSAHFPHFPPTCFDILSWNFAHDFVLMYYRSSSTVVTFRQFLKELCLFVNLEYR